MTQQHAPPSLYCNWILLLLYLQRLPFTCIAKLHRLLLHSLTQVKFGEAMQTWHCLVMLCSESCYCHGVLSLAVLVGSDHNWCHGFQWMSLVARSTHCICFPCTEGRFGKGGWVNHLHPATHHIGFLQQRKEKRGSAGKPWTLTTLRWTVPDILL